MKNFKFLFALCFLAACASNPVQQGSERNPESVGNGLPERHLTLLFHANRRSELEPCGCSLAPSGGIEREWTLLEQTKKNSLGPVIALASGTTFVPEANLFKDKATKFYQKKSQAVVDTLSTLGVQAFAPSANDFRLGVKHLKTLESQSSFPWVLANVVERRTGKPVFKGFYQLKIDQDEYLVVGLTADAQKEFRSSEIEVIPPKKALENVLNEQLKTKKTIILLGDLSAKDRESLGGLLKQVNLVLGGQDSEPTNMHWQQLHPQTLLANPTSRARSYAVAHFTWTEPVIGYFSPSFNDELTFSKNALEKAITENKSLLSSIKSKQKKKDIQKKTDDLMAALQSVSAPVTPGLPGYARVDSEIVELTKAYDSGSNPMSSILSQWKTEVQSLARKTTP